MPPDFLVPEAVVREDGNGPELELGASEGRTLILTLGITRIIEQESIDVSIWASTDRSNWGAKPLLHFPQKFYCGTYQIILDLSDKPDVKYLRAQWKLNRWGRGATKPLFGIYLFTQELADQPLTARSA